MDKNKKNEVYVHTLQRIEALIAGETDLVAVMSTVCCEIYHAFDHLNWVGFYRRVDQKTLKVGPYQGTHGCLTIEIGRGVCGACARTAAVQLENDVSKAPSHIACSSETRAELVLPVLDENGCVTAVLDLDSTELNVFDDVDVKHLTTVCAWVASRVPGAA